MDRIEDLIPEGRKFFRNLPQIKHSLTWCQTQFNIWGRGTGKSEGPEAEHSSLCAVTMPGSKGAFVADTLVNIRAKQLPPIVSGWEKLGFINGLHFFYNEFPPKKLFPKWQAPPGCPLEPKDCIFWWNGSMQFLFGLDRNFNNGVSLDYLIVLEAKNIKQEDYKEVALTVRGNQLIWGENSEKPLAQHSSILISSDMPTEPRGLWLLDAEKDYDPSITEDLMDLQEIKIEIQNDLIENKNYYDNHPRKKTNKENELELIEDTINKARINSIGYNFASSLENIDVLGINKIVQFAQTLKPAQFLASVLGERILRPERFFYAINSENHGYQAIDYSYVDNVVLGEEETELWYNDSNRTEPLHVGFDYNYAINSLTVGQLINKEIKVVNFFSGLKSDNEGLEDVIAKFCAFYSTRDEDSKMVVYHYYHTALQGRSAVSDIRISDYVINAFHAQGWRVYAKYHGQAPSHYTRYKKFDDLFNETDSNGLTIGFNLERTDQLRTSLLFAPVKIVQGEIRKDKSSENSTVISPIQATHATESFDDLAMGILSDYSSTGSSGVTGLITSKGSSTNA